MYFEQNDDGQFLHSMKYFLIYVLKFKVRFNNRNFSKYKEYNADQLDVSFLLKFVPHFILNREGK